MPKIGIPFPERSSMMDLLVYHGMKLRRRAIKGDPIDTVRALGGISSVLQERES